MVVLSKVNSLDETSNKTDPSIPEPEIVPFVVGELPATFKESVVYATNLPF